MAVVAPSSGRVDPRAPDPTAAKDDTWRAISTTDLPDTMAVEPTPVLVSHQ